MYKDKPLVSIDIFDTAVFRDVFTPKEVFQVIENKVQNNFYKLRVEAQVQAGRKNPNFNLIDIYKLLPSKFSMKDEILAEIHGTYANPYILDLYNKREADFIFISDMYLPSSVLKMLLEHAGYKNPVVFVSCEEGCSKSSGKLFLKVQEKLEREISKHIGDNYNADIEGAKKAGISETEYVGPAVYHKEVVTPPLQNPKLRKFLIDKELSDSPIEEKIGYIFAPLTLVFTQYVLDKAKGEQTIFFNARDSFLMYIVARWILKTKKKIRYCRFSRKSVNLSGAQTKYNLTNKRNARFFKFLYSSRVRSLQDFLDSFKINSSRDYSKILRKYNISSDTDFFFNPERTNLMKEFLVLIEDDIYEKVKQERSNIGCYLKKLNMKNGDIFVDLGHFGSMQSVLNETFNLKLIGEYIHLFSSYKTVYADDLIKNSFFPEDFLKFYTGISEMVFTEPIGTTCGYSKKGIPMLSNCEKSKKEFIKRVTSGVLKGVKELLKGNIEISKGDSQIILTRFFEHPTVKEAEFANVDVYDNGSLFATESVVWYDRNRIKQGKIKECYSKSYWKPAFKVLLENDLENKQLVKGLR